MLRVDDEISVDEDLHNEFRMHVRNCLSEIPPRCEANYRGMIVRKMQPNSKTICAFLNTDGGRIYLGINDRGIVRGLRMTRSMREHFLLSLHHCLKSFTPRVHPDLVKLQIINLGDESSETSVKSYVVGSDDEDEPIQTHSKITGYHTREHMIGGFRCPCDNSILTSESSLYLIVIKISKSPDGTIYQNDEGLVYRRRNGSNKMVSINDINKYMSTDRLETDIMTSILFLLHYVKTTIYRILGY